MERQLRETRVLAERNHELLEKVHRYIVLSRIFRIVYWVVIIGIAIGAFYFLEPYLETLTGSIDSFQGVFEGFQSQ